jgi:hypothetical protein
MTDRIPLDDMTSDQLDHLYADLDRYEEVLATLNETLVARSKQTARADASASSHADRANTAEATLARVHAYAVHAIDAGDTGPGPTLGRLLLQLLDGDTAATEATRPATWLTVGNQGAALMADPSHAAQALLIAFDEAQLAEMHAAASARIKQVRALHVQEYNTCDWCSTNDRYVDWPCPTIRALNGEEPR